MVAGSNSSRVGTYEEFFFWDCRHHCHIEVGAYGWRTLLFNGCNISTTFLCRYTEVLFFFTALHGMQTRSSDEDFVRLSVCLSVKRLNCDKTEERSVQIFVPYERSFSLVFWDEEWFVGANPSTWNFGSTSPHWSEIAGAEWSVEWAWQKTMERERSGERAKSAAHSPLQLQHNISLPRDFISYIVRIELSTVYSFSPHSSTLHALALSLVQTRFNLLPITQVNALITRFNPSRRHDAL